MRLVHRYSPIGRSEAAEARFQTVGQYPIKTIRPGGEPIYGTRTMRSVLRRSLKSVVGHYYRFKLVTDWPKWAGDLLEVKIPANLTRKAALSPEGGSNINLCSTAPATCLGMLPSAAFSKAAA
jgi:hypothetical protein